MTLPEYINIGVTVIAAFAAICSAVSAYKSTKLASSSLELQKPRPVLVIERQADSKSLVLLNMGNDTAFDIEVGDLKIPDFSLKTQPLKLLLAGASNKCHHRLHDEVYDESLQRFQILAGHYYAKFDSNTPKRLEFSLSYRASDTLLYTCSCLMWFDRADSFARIEPLHSWLPNFVK